MMLCIDIETVTHWDQITPHNMPVKSNFITEKYRFYAIYCTSAFVCALRVVSVKALAFTSLCVFVFLSDSKQNGDANAALSEEEGCSMTQPLSPSEKWSLRCSRGRDKTKKEATCFLLSSGDSNVHSGKLHTYQRIPKYRHLLYRTFRLHAGCFLTIVMLEFTSLGKSNLSVCFIRFFCFPPLSLSWN